MKNVQQNFIDHLSQNVTTTAICIHLTLNDETEYYFTNHDQVIVFGGNAYSPYFGSVPSATKTNVNMAVDNMTITGILDPTTISESDIRTGELDFAAIEMFTVNYDDPDTYGSISGITGIVGESWIEGNKFTLELRGISQLIQQKMGRTYGVSCDAEFADTRCGLDGNDSDYLKLLNVGGVDPDNNKRIF